MGKTCKQLYHLLLGLLCLFLVGITFGSCEAEKNFETAKGRITIKRCSMKNVALLSNKKLMLAFNQFKSLQANTNENSNVNAKLVYDQNSGLYFDDEKGIYVSKDGKESYNFPIIQNDITEKIKNITFNKNTNNEYDIYIVKYDYSKEDLENYTKEALAERQIKYYPLVKDGVIYTNQLQWMICWTTYVIETWVEYHEGIELRCSAIVSISEDCESGGGADGGPGPTGGNPVSSGDGDETGGGATGQNNGNNSGGSASIISTAALDGGGPTNPCGDLRMNTENLQFRQDLNALNKPVNFIKHHETGFITTKNGNLRGHTYLEASDEVNSNHIDIKSVPYGVSFMHVHNDSYPITDNDGVTETLLTAKSPSAADLLNFFRLQYIALNQGIPLNLTYGLTISRTAIYTFKLKTADFTVLTNILNSSGINWEKFQKDLDNKQKDISYQNLSPQEEKEAQEKLFLKKLKKYGLDQLVGVYQGTPIGSDPISGVNWEEKVLDENGKIRSKPCNN